MVLNFESSFLNCNSQKRRELKDFIESECHTVILAGPSQNAFECRMVNFEFSHQKGGVKDEREMEVQGQVSHACFFG